MSELINGRMPEHIKAGLRCRVAGDVECSDCAYYGTVLYEIGQREYECDDIDRDALALIEHLESERDAALAKVPKWISVEEQPNPPEDGEYWCHGYWLKSGRKQTESAEYLGEWKIANNFILTHWMPLPEPPKEDA